MALANVTVTTTEPNVAVSSDNVNVSVSSTSSTITVGNATVVANADIRNAISNVSPILYDSSTGVISFDANLDDLTLKKYQETIVDNGTTGGNISLDIANGTVHKFTLNSNVTGISFSNLDTGGSATLQLTQDASGGRYLDTTTFASNWTNFKFLNDDTTLSGSPSKISIINVFYNGTDYIATVIPEESLAVNFSNITATGNITAANIVGTYLHGDGSNITGVASLTDLSVTTNSPSGNGALAYNNTTGVFSFTPSDVPDNTDELTEGSTNLYFTNARANTVIGTNTTDNLTEGATNLYFTTARANTVIGTNTTDNLTEGATNLYFTNALSRASISVGTPATPSGNGSLSYNNVNGVFTFTPPNKIGYTDLSVITAGPSGNGSLSYDSAGVFTYTPPDLSAFGLTNAQAQAFIQDNGLNGSGDITMTGTAAFGNSATQTHTFTGNLSVTGNAEISGNLNYRNVTDLYVQDQSITLNANAATDATVEIIANRPVAGANTVLRWNETDDKWQFSNDGSTYYPIPTSTTDLAEGTNLYFSNTNLATSSTTHLPEGTNLYFSNTNLATSSTTHLPEGTNLYFTTDRANSAIEAHTGNIANLTGDVTTTGNITGGYIIAGNDAGGEGIFIGDINGAIQAEIYNASGNTLNKGDIVALNGAAHGSTPDVVLADASNASLMPGFGVVKNQIVDGVTGEVVISGKMNFSSHGFTVGAQLYVNGAGQFTETQPEGEGNLVQKVATVTNANTINVAGAGRTNATPNLDDGNIFLGNVNNQSASAVLDTSIVPENGNLYYTDARSRAAVSVTSNTPSGNGSLSYDNGTGVFTFTPADAVHLTNAEVQTFIQDNGLAMTANLTSNSLISTTGNLQINPDTEIDGLKGLTYDSTNNFLGLGTTTPEAAFHQISDNNGLSATVLLTEYSTATSAGDFRFQRANNTLASPGLVELGDRIGQIRWEPAYQVVANTTSYGIDFNSTLEISGFADGTQGATDTFTNANGDFSQYSQHSGNGIDRAIQDVQAHDYGTLTVDSITFADGQVYDDGTRVVISGVTESNVTPLQTFSVFYLKYVAGDGGRYELYDDDQLTTGSQRVTGSGFYSSGVGEVEVKADQLYFTDTSVAYFSGQAFLFSGATDANVTPLNGNIAYVTRTASGVNRRYRLYKDAARTIPWNLTGTIDLAGLQIEVSHFYQPTGLQIDVDQSLANSIINTSIIKVRANGEIQLGCTDTFEDGTGNVIITTEGNITSVANISGAYILGDGSQLTNLPATYGNANVSNYLSANVVTANIETQGNIVVNQDLIADNDVKAANALFADQIFSYTGGGTISFTSARFTDAGFGGGNYFFPDVGGDTDGGVLQSQANSIGFFSNSISNLNTLTADDVIIRDRLQLKSYSNTEILALTGLTAGEVVYNSTDNLVAYYDGTNWRNIAQGAVIT